MVVAVTQNDGDIKRAESAAWTIVNACAASGSSRRHDGTPQIPAAKLRLPQAMSPSRTRHAAGMNGGGWPLTAPSAQPASGFRNTAAEVTGARRARLFRPPPPPPLLSSRWSPSVPHRLSVRRTPRGPIRNWTIAPMDSRGVRGGRRRQRPRRGGDVAKAAARPSREEVSARDVVRQRTWEASNRNQRTTCSPPEDTFIAKHPPQMKGTPLT